MKKVLSVALASAMVLGMGANAFAISTALALTTRLIGRATSNLTVNCL